MQETDMTKTKKTRTSTTTALTPFAGFNQRRIHPVDWEHNNGRLADRLNGARRLTAPELAELLREAADTLETVPPTDLETMADLYCFLALANDTMPLVECWVVTKHYADTDPASAWYKKTATWCGATTKQHAEELAVAIEEHYAQKYPHHRRDRFKVSRGECRATDVIRPETSAEEYARRLG